MSDHKHKIWIKRKDIRTCVECGEVLGIAESDFPEDERYWLDMFALAAMEGTIGHEPNNSSAVIAERSYDMADAMIAERRRRMYKNE